MKMVVKLKNSIGRPKIKSEYIISPEYHIISVGAGFSL